MHFDRSNFFGNSILNNRITVEMEPEKVNQYIFIGTVGIGAVTVSYLLLQLYMKFSGKKVVVASSEGKGRARSMSFNSSVLLAGIFPPEAEVRPAIINSLFLFKTCPSAKSLEEACKNLAHFDRFKNGVKHNGKEWQFVETEVVFSNHIKTVGVVSEKNMMEECDRIVQNGVGEYDGEKPLWVFHRIVNAGTGLSGLLIRIHHVIGDGISLVNAMSRILTDEFGSPININIPDGKISAKDSGKDAERPPPPGFFQVAKSALDILTLPVSKYDSKTFFAPEDPAKKKMTKKIKSIVFPTVKLEFIKSIKNKAHVTVNDVLLSIFTGALWRYCENRKDPATQGKAAAKLSTRCLMPVSLPRPSEQYSNPVTALRNFFVMVSIPIPFQPLSAKERLYKCHATTSALKRSPTPGVQMWLQNFLPNILPQAFQQKTAFDIFSRHTCVFSNVPGPADLISLCGEQVVGMQILFPNILPNVILISYAGAIYFNMNMDDELLPGAAEELPKYYLEELKELAKEYGLDQTQMLSELSPEGFMGVSTTD